MIINIPVTIKNNLNRTDQHERKLGLGDLMLFSDWTIYSDASCNMSNEILDFVKNCNPTKKEDKEFQLTSDFQDLKEIVVNNKIFDNFIDTYIESLEHGY